MKEDNNFDLIKNIMTGEIDPENQFPRGSLLFTLNHTMILPLSTVSVRQAKIQE